MDTNQKVSNWQRSPTILLGLVVLYLLSYGPYDWLYTWGLISPALQASVDAFYLPLNWTVLHGPRSAADVLEWYVQFWVPPGSRCAYARPLPIGSILWLFATAAILS